MLVGSIIGNSNLS